MTKPLVAAVGVSTAVAGFAAIYSAVREPRHPNAAGAYLTGTALVAVGLGTLTYGVFA